ncbi:MAG: GyrI-like domain-containing protein [Lewinella sp.]
MPPQIINLPPTTLVGHSQEMSLANDQTRSLFQGFMPQRNTIMGRTDKRVYDLRVYEPGLDFLTFGPTTVFTKWAAVEIDGAQTEQAGFHSFHLTGGLYACFEHKGPASDVARVFGYIFQQWLPFSGYQLDDRPHFEIMPEGYQPMAPDAEEQIWIPIKTN